MRRIVIDRIDINKNLAILEIGEKIIEISTDLIPANSKEGDILKLVTDRKETDFIKNKINALESKLFK